VDTNFSSLQENCIFRGSINSLQKLQLTVTQTNIIYCHTPHSNECHLKQDKGHKYTVTHHHSNECHLKQDKGHK